MTSTPDLPAFNLPDANVQLFRHVTALDLLMRDLGDTPSTAEMDEAQEAAERFAETMIASLDATIVGPSDEPGYVTLRVRLLDIDPLIDWIEKYEAEFEVAEDLAV